MVKIFSMANRGFHHSPQQGVDAEMKSDLPVKCSVCQSDEGTFFSTGNYVHAGGKHPNFREFFRSVPFLPDFNLQNSGP
jgi:hypothetical protein